MANLTRDDLEHALVSGQRALGVLIDRLTPVIQARVARSLLRRRPAGSYNVRQEVEDMAQEVFLVLFNEDARILRSWNPERGLSLENFVGFVTERQVVSILRTGKRNPWKEDPTLTEQLDRTDPAAGPEDTVAGRHVLRQLLRRLEEQLSPLGRQLFDLIYLREKTVAEIRQETGLRSDAVYAWRSRLRRLARKLLTEMMSEGTMSEIAGPRRRPL